MATTRAPPSAPTRAISPPRSCGSPVRALQVDARDAGYRPGEWIAAGVVGAELSTAAAEHPAATVDHLEHVACSIAAAIIATENDVMAVSEHLSSALGAGLALYASIVEQGSSS